MDLFDYLLAKQSGGGGGSPEIFEARVFETTYQEVDEAFTSGKLVLLKDRDGLQYLAGIPWHEEYEYVFYAIHEDGTIDMLVVDTSGWRVETAPMVFWVTYNLTTYAEIAEANRAGRLCVLKQGGAIAILESVYGTEAKFVNVVDSVIQHYTCSDNNEWNTYSDDTQSIYFAQPNASSFMDIVQAVQESKLPVINDLANGRAYYVSDYTMVGGQAAAITFSTIGANTPHTWTVDYQDNWTST